MNLEIFHALEGQLIAFKPLCLEDDKAIYPYASNSDVSRFIGWELKNTLEETHDYIAEMLRRQAAQTHLYASIMIKGTDTLVGTAMLFNFDHVANQAEVGYVLHQDFWGKGYASEAVALMDCFARETLGLHRIHARVVSGNMASARVLVKNGFDLEGRLRDHYKIEGQYYDGLILGKVYG